MLYKNAKNILSKAFNSTKDLAKIAKNGYEINLSEASTKMEKHMVESAKNLMKENKISKEAISNGMLKLTGEEALRARYYNSSIMSGQDPFLKDMADIGKIAAAGIVGIKTTQAAVSLISGD